MPQIAKAHVVLVDDAPDFLEPIVFWLESKGYRVTTFNDGASALRFLETQVPDLIFLDIQMPGIDGLQTLEQIRVTHKKLPVVMLTGSFHTKLYFTKASQLGASGFFPKQSSLDELVEIIETTLRAHGLGGSDANR